MFPIPHSRPAHPFFSSGPTKKYPGYDPTCLMAAHTGRSHRNEQGRERIKTILDLTRDVLDIPEDYKVILIPGSGTGAIECALWSFLGARPVDVFSWDVFGKLWITDIIQQLKLPTARIFEEKEAGHLPDLFAYHSDHDVVFTWNGTSSGICVPHIDWLPSHRQGLSICDATSAAFCVPLKWGKLDVTTFSWQKGLGGEGGHGMMVLSPRALDRLQTYTPSWPVPRLFRLWKNESLNNALFEGATLNTPSMLCVQDYYCALKWAKSIGGIRALSARCQSNFWALTSWIHSSKDYSLLAKNGQIVSPSVVFTPTALQNKNWVYINRVAGMLSHNGIGHDIANHNAAPASFRIWCGPTIETEDVISLCSWLDYYSTISSFS